MGRTAWAPKTERCDTFPAASDCWAARASRFRLLGRLGEQHTSSGDVEPGYPPPSTPYQERTGFATGSAKNVKTSVAKRSGARLCTR